MRIKVSCEGLSRMKRWQIHMHVSDGRTPIEIEHDRVPRVDQAHRQLLDILAAVEADIGAVIAHRLGCDCKFGRMDGNSTRLQALHCLPDETQTVSVAADVLKCACRP